MHVYTRPVHMDSPRSAHSPAQAMVLLKAEITVLKAMCGVYVGSLFLSAPTPLLDLTHQKPKTSGASLAASRRGGAAAMGPTAPETTQKPESAAS